MAFHRNALQTPLELFQEFERFVVAAALKIMGQLRIDRAWQCRLQLVDFFRNGAQPSYMRFCIAPALFIRNEGEALSQSFSKIRETIRFGGLETAAPCIGDRVFHCN